MTSVWSVQNRSMNSSWEGNNSSRPFCLLGFSYNETANICLLEVIIIVFLTVLIISGNLIVILVFHFAPLLNQHTTSYFIQTMAYADLFVGISCLVPSLSLLRYPTGSHESLTCKLFGYIVSVLKSVSMTSLACISVDRYIAITKPLSYSQLVTPWRLRVCIIIIWLYSFIVFLPAFFGWGKPGYHGDIFEWCANSWETNVYFAGFIVALLYAPAAFVVCFTYFNIFRICQHHTKEIRERHARFNTQGETSENPASSEKRYAMVLLRITSVFYILWLPYIIYFLLESCRFSNSPEISFLTTWLAISNSFCNCVTYSLSNSVFRKSLKRVSGAVCASCIWYVESKNPSMPGSKRSSNGCNT
ncbi:probable G-protein coupled receptor 21 [Chiloscyllium plagiosum]|uniref:probable G-protein coupled receptor 21 n=1 Tax=Chiloscyllium plagiosum TaxID=36176 RepID=UPI001CB828F9|nr:probable G-protein coupled receptor 21 [Chiloscyllium plagiosum]